MNEIVAIVETTLSVDDLDLAETFYRDVLGLHFVDKAVGRHVFFQVGGRMLLLFNPEESSRPGLLPPHGSRGQGHFALGIPADGLAYWRARLESHGVPIEHEQDWPRGGRSLYFRDPAGNLGELITPGVWGLPSGW